MAYRDELALRIDRAFRWAVQAAALVVAVALAGGCATSVEPTTPPTIALAAPPSTSGSTARPSPRQVVQLALGFEHGCAVLGDGSLHCWGLRASPLITGELHTSLRPVRATGVGPVREAASGINGTCVLELEGVVRCWGGGFVSLLGDDHGLPVVVQGSEGLRSLSMGGRHVCGLAGDGGVRCWGKNDDGQLGDGTLYARGEAQPVLNVTGAVAIATGAAASAAVTADGRVWQWGDDHAAQPASPSDDPTSTPNPTPRLVVGVDDAVEVALSNTMACARRRDGRVVCWGDLPVAGGMYERSMTPVSVEGLGAVKQVVAGAQHVCALQAEGTVACWGVVPGWHVWRPKPMLLEGLADITAIAAGSFHQCAIRRDGEVLCLGDGGAGQLGDGARTRMRKEPLPVRW
jgi:alpha-tubulin suppressor-like RCC1 family protein